MIGVQFVDHPTERVGEVVYGPYDGVQLSYEELRDSEGEVLAHFEEGRWLPMFEGRGYSDVVIGNFHALVEGNKR